MKHATRLKRLELSACQLLQPPPRVPYDEQRWLAEFERLGQSGEFDREPDFPRALALYRDAITQAKAQIDPSFDPPESFQPDISTRWARLADWRSDARFPKVAAGLEWLCEMLRRWLDDIPPVSEVEYGELASWFEENADRLRDVERSLPSQMLPLNTGLTTCAQIRHDLRHGPRAEGAGRAADAIQQLRARHGEPVAL